MPLPPLTTTGWLRYDPIRSLLRRLDEARAVLEIGTGLGALGARLAQRYDYVGLEPDEHSHRTALRRIEPRGGTVLNGDVSVLPADRTFDLICAFEVLEHIQDDRQALEQWRTRLRRPGWILLSVPAFQRRFGSWDVLAGHYRRYEREGITNLVRVAGFRDPLVWTYGFPIGYLLEGIRNGVARLRPRRGTLAERTRSSGRGLQPPEALGWLTWLAALPFRVLQKPFRHTRHGIGLIVLAERAE